MNLGGYYPPPYTNQNAPYPNYPQQQYPQYGRPLDPYGAVLPGYPFHPFPAQNPEYQYRNENPCNCCCDLLPAARIISIFNLFYLLLELIDAVAPESPFFWGRRRDYSYHRRYYNDKVGKDSDPFEESDPQLFHNCLKYQADEAGGFFLLVTIVFASAILAYMLATLGFIIAVFASPGKGSELCCSNSFMWISFTYPGWLAHILLFINILGMEERCSKSSNLWTKHIFGAVGIAVFSMFNGLVGRAFRKMVERRYPVVQQGIGIGDGVSAITTASGGAPPPYQY